MKRTWLIPLWLAACAHRPPTELFGEPLPIECKHKDDASREHCIGWAYARLSHAWSLPYDDAALKQYVADVGDGLAAHSSRSELVWSFSVLDGPSIDAYAAPGGWVYLTRGLLAQLNSEAELATVLGHEVGHIAGRHPNYWESHQDTRAVGDASHRGDQERQADHLGVRYAIASGYDPAQCISAFRSLFRVWGHTEGGPHPPKNVRMARLRVQIGRRKGGTIGRDRYFDHIDGLSLGVDPRTGYVHQNRYVRADDRFSLAIPKGWSGHARAGRLVVRNKSGTVLFVVWPTTSAQAFRDVLQKDKKHLRNIAGHKVWVGSSKRATKRGHIHFRGLADGNTATAVITIGKRDYVFMLNAIKDLDAGEGIARFLSTLKEETDPDLLDVAPRRLRIKRVPLTQTLRAFANAGCGNLKQVAELNNLYPRSRLRRGRRIKCIEPGRLVPGRPVPDATTLARAGELKR